jgi:hypothetical protein
MTGSAYDFEIGIRDVAAQISGAVEESVVLRTGHY